jgi:flagellin-specific chaperone FliS
MTKQIQKIKGIIFFYRNYLNFSKDNLLIQYLYTIYIYILNNFLLKKSNDYYKIVIQTFPFINFLSFLKDKVKNFPN